VIEARDVDNIYAVPEAYHEAGLDDEVLASFGLTPKAPLALQSWHDINERVRNPEGAVTIAIVGKYTGMKDAYKSLTEALSHGGIANKVKVNLDWIESEVFENEDPRRSSNTSTASWCPAASASAAPRARSARRVLPGSATCLISASASACRWR
jgi:CTP synthase (UTP-ammonia lyase)